MVMNGEINALIGTIGMFTLSGFAIIMSLVSNAYVPDSCIIFMMGLAIVFAIWELGYIIRSEKK
jgi:hypothetical protein